MTDRLDEKMVRAFPLLYRDRYGDMRSTCMVWGFPFNEKNPGWFDLIWDLSSKLEPLIQKYLDENKPTDCANCGCEEKLHDYDLLENCTKIVNGRCNNLHYLPYSFRWKWKPYSWPSKVTNWKDHWKIFKAKYIHFLVIERIKNWISRAINFVLDDILHQQFGITKVKPCWCKKFLLNHPCAIQVKSKLAGLRFYMTSGTDEMYKLIHDAEEKSYHICEVCGAGGKLRDDRYWIETLCDNCEKNRIKETEEEN